MSDERYEVKVENVFEGPMDLLIYLIKKHEVDIYDIPIGLITEQYLGYLEWMKAMSINVAGDFILMASTLTQIKSRMLLPVHETLEEEEDPRLELTRPLLEYLRLKAAAEQLEDRELLGVDTFLRGVAEDEIAFDPSEREIQVSLFELIDAFQRILSNMSAEHRLTFDEERFSIQDKISELVDVLEERGTVTFHELFSPNLKKDELIVTFLAILEMGKLCLVRITQQVQTGIIRLFYI
ncbi:chromosome segregation protein ScpA [Desulfonema ishimotonii]|uniref:Segregation and condensation protein A n=1 Tax=Desulfonema ishimotonii TaxID=45657 RepID=A0A401FYE8_9BACT|nr:segregation/condensation protein A [Desulfonema ishimotonii]GBC61966.1 chromosome segregation protein ScpA [Desulfonema ishimotonii]